VESNQILKTNDVKNKFSQDFIENISTMSAGITKLDVLDEKWNGETFWMKAAITVDTTSLKDSLKKLSEDRQKVKELEDLKQQLDTTNKKLASLTLQLNEQKEINEKSALADKYNAKVNEISAANAMYNAKAKINEKNYDGALAELNTVISLNPKYTVAYAYRGHVKVYLQDYIGAVDDFNKAIELKPKFDAAYVDRGHAKNFLGDYQGAIADFSKAIDISGNYAYAYTSRGETKLKLKDYQASIDDFDKAIHYDSNYGMAYVNRGIAKTWLGQKGCSDWNKAAQLDCEPAIDLIKKYCR
jgi:tetratricopeptide (TPR) repeat protein